MRPLSAPTCSTVPEKPLLQTDQTSRSPKFPFVADISYPHSTDRKRTASQFMPRMKAEIASAAQRGVPARSLLVRQRF
jgi:hypothetical protein